VSIAKRIARATARTIGTPVGLGLMVVLRLSARTRGVALMYHSVDVRQGDPQRELVPPHPASVFAAQVRLVARHYRVVPARDLQQAAAARRRGQRFPVAITFDDDLRCHATLAAPVLQDAGVTGTFFLSGASLERPFAFWYERLQRAWDEEVPGLTALVLGADTPGSAELGLFDLALRVELMEPAARDGVAERLAQVLGPDPEAAGIRSAEVRSLVERGMTVGFHTRRHDSLSLLADGALERALREGVEELEAACGTRVEVIGYPHGRADARVGAAARGAGFVAGYTTQPDAVTPADEPLLLGRVGPSLRSSGALAVQLALTLLRAGSARPSPAAAP
jgi:peptidoglycan/xylan/chitin deacetylase (PgdA/CDA1 family)